MLTIYRRHRTSCPHRSAGRKYRRCRCPIWVDGFVGGVEIRKSLGLWDWEKAQATVRDWEAEGERQPPEEEPITIAAACDEFIADLRRRQVTDGTVGKYRLLFRTLQSYAADKGVRYLKQLELPFLRSFCTTWTEAALTQLKKLERLRAFLRFGVESQ